MVSEDNINHPPHYKQHPSGVECIQITEHMNFCLGNAVKYIWRADLKADAVEDLEKAHWYLAREIQRRQGFVSGGPQHPVYTFEEACKIMEEFDSPAAVFPDE